MSILLISLLKMNIRETRADTNLPEEKLIIKNSCSSSVNLQDQIILNPVLCHGKNLKISKLVLVIIIDNKVAENHEFVILPRQNEP